ncbi:hypothetical protein NDU88_004144 [Pleurodeles waltl]|uniref:Uncharacterized protein n=1 Tax=Pleurodeles waltl TaxID=8319 RepID=A0AAV7W6Z8_PLEWA|nr:hypothetical protein NDU88_004144 [Pleurodeles waltl]
MGCLRLELRGIISRQEFSLKGSRDKTRLSIKIPNTKGLSIRTTWLMHDTGPAETMNGLSFVMKSYTRV